VNGETDLKATGGLVMLPKRRARRSVAAGAFAILAMSILVAIRTANASVASASNPGISSNQTENTASIFIRKNDLNFHHLAGAVFSVEGVAGTKTTDAEGGACFTGLPQNVTLKVTEISPPPGYTLPDPNSQMVHVDNDGDCTSRDVLFVDAPAASSSPSGSASGTASGSASPSGSASGTASGSASASSSGSPEGSVQGTSGSPEGSVKAATGSPAVSVPNTAYGPSGPNSTLLSVFLLALLVSLSTLASMYASRIRRR
jgi:Prealbumin-like fold domain